MLTEKQKYQFLLSFRNWLIRRKKVKENRQKSFNKRFDKMTVQERLEFDKAYNSYNYYFPWKLLLAPFYLFFYLGLLQIVAFYAFGIDFKIPFLLLIAFVFELYPVLWYIFVLVVLLQLINSNRYRRKIVKIIGVKK